tara:strand:- start:66 stop:533 length:468 start_codon:yes stop_codon:yes gene_type:complete
MVTLKKENKVLVDKAFNCISSYKEKVGVNCMGYKMQLDILRISVKDEVQFQLATEYLVELLTINKLWKISRVSFDTKEIYKARLITFHDSLVEQGILVKDKTMTNRFLLVNSDTNIYYTVGANITPSPMPKEITRHELVKNRKVSKKEVAESLAK